ncbi:MAG TPA: serine/threonine-protein kinase, partial [Gemmatimonadales bacterium]|nr:serine/threonine-protein kinase [Gemmatimonadales bacterium]
MEIDPLKERLQRALGPDYRVDELLGRGGMGYVYLVHNLKLNRGEAVKVLRPEFDTADGGEGFLREARILATIRHRNVVVIYDEDQGEGLKYYRMELVGGPTLEERVKSVPIPMDQVIAIGIDILDGLEQVHRLGIVHRDIKPSNIFVLPGDHALLGDFGIARPPTEPGDEHSSDGTVAYMAPEQLHGGPITPRTDVYATGVSLYEAVTGRPYHEQWPHIDWTGIPEPLASVLRRAVEEKPEDRWADAAAFRQALKNVFEATQLTPQEQAESPPIWKPAAVIGAVLAVVAFVLIWRPWDLNRGAPAVPPPPPPPSPTPGVSLAIEYDGPRDRRYVADSLRRMVRSDLGSHIP